MVFVRVGEDQRLDVLEPVLDVPEVGQDEVDTGLVVAGEEHPAVDDEQSSQMLENRHVAADFTDAAESGDPQRTRNEWTGRLEVFVHYRGSRSADAVATEDLTPRTAAARISAASSSTWSGAAGI